MSRSRAQAEEIPLNGQRTGNSHEALSRTPTLLCGEGECTRKHSLEVVLEQQGLSTDSSHGVMLQWEMPAQHRLQLLSECVEEEGRERDKRAPSQPRCGLSLSKNTAQSPRLFLSPNDRTVLFIVKALLSSQGPRDSCPSEAESTAIPPAPTPVLAVLV